MLLIGGKLVNFRNLLLSFVLYFCKDTLFLLPHNFYL